jgi:hypothetical protein
VGTYVLGKNWDNRMIFLLLVLPCMLQMERKPLPRIHSHFPVAITARKAARRNLEQARPVDKIDIELCAFHDVRPPTSLQEHSAFKRHFSFTESHPQVSGPSRNVPIPAK